MFVCVCAHSSGSLRGAQIGEQLLSVTPPPPSGCRQFLWHLYCHHDAEPPEKCCPECYDREHSNRESFVRELLVDVWDTGVVPDCQSTGIWLASHILLKWYVWGLPDFPNTVGSPADYQPFWSYFYPWCLHSYFNVEVKISTFIVLFNKSCHPVFVS